MKCWAVLYSSGYAPETTVTEFPSLNAVVAEYKRRMSNPYYPCWGDKGEVGDEYVGYIYESPLPDNDSTDQYPDRVLVLGPKGGLRIVAA